MRKYFEESIFTKAPKAEPKFIDIDSVFCEGGANITADHVKRECVYFVGEAKKYCRATTQTSCRLCKAYNPKLPDKAQRIAQLLKKERANSDRLYDELTKTDKELLNANLDLKKTKNKLKTEKAMQKRIFDEF